ncbi:acylphosphatase-2 isoform X1 [Astyanax mexicanus]|uniref:acylphosphatase-2 isoform X1 n=1 Tax=Astyanax mexicanus TaxID=7994 RepID=UPI0020CB3ACC|nr:acylphosphatase-2 isoform X1 [Astyanax mexicanus]
MARPHCACTPRPEHEIRHSLNKLTDQGRTHYVNEQQFLFFPSFPPVSPTLCVDVPLGCVYSCLQHFTLPGKGVCFRMYTEDQGKKLGVNGWVKNTRQGTVIGQVQGPRDKVDEMKHWLRHVGSPSSRIDRAEFSNERDISKLEIRGFGTRY